MKKLTTLTLAVLLALTLLSGALADTLTLNGTVTAAGAATVYAPIGGTVESVCVQPGQRVGEDDVLYTMRTAKVYAQESGTVTGIFGEPGDSAAAVAERYGAVLWLEGEARYTVSASTANAYNSTETKMIHVGEKLYLQCRSNNKRTGEGTVTAVEGTNYTVRVTEGDFIPGDSVDLFRDAAFSSDRRVGRGNVSRVNPTPVTAGGAIVAFAVADGQQVRRGDLLLETLDGAFEGLYMSGTAVTAGASGVVGSIGVSQGSAVQDGAAVAVIWPTDTMRVQASVPEDSRGLVKIGDPVRIELEADESKTYSGTVTMVSWIAEEGDGEASYRVLIDFTPDADVTFGMGVIVSTLDGEVEDDED
ncbi:MAG: HlyD family efflux transporter periplasmic adaptor subunit [Clostridia bacterium]|nr:HlyD family efflux transporter periplasmic adaptor subunit [Clostridia bacterium]